MDVVIWKKCGKVTSVPFPPHSLDGSKQEEPWKVPHVQIGGCEDGFRLLVTSLMGPKQNIHHKPANTFQLNFLLGSANGHQNILQWKLQLAIPYLWTDLITQTFHFGIFNI